MATIKKSKANLSAGPSKMTKRAGPIDPNGKWTKVQERTIGNMKTGGVIKAQGGKKINWGTAPAPAGLDSKKSFKKKSDAAKASYTANTNPTVDYKSRKMVTPGGITGGQSVSVDTTGMAAGKKRFPTKVTMRSGKDVYYPINKASAKRAIKYTQKNGGKTAKKK
jgi:hypothetical protein